VKRDDITLVAAGLVCAFALVLLGYENGHWLFGSTMIAIGFASVWVAPWLWLKFIANGFAIPPGNPEEAAAFRSAAGVVLRIGIPVWLAEITYFSLPSDWQRFDLSMLFAVLQLATPITGALLGFRARVTRKKNEGDAGAPAPPQADQSSSRTP